MSSLESSVLKTLALFAAQDKAATLTELSALLVRVSPEQRQPELSQILAALEGPMRDRVSGQNGLYCLRGYERTWRQRLSSYNHTLGLFRRARRYASVLRHIPYVRAVAISGSCAQLNASSSSDIDLFIISQPGRIFIARLLVSAFFQLIGLRRHGQKIRGRFCLNHYVVDGLNIAQDRTQYTALLYTSFIPIFGAAHIELFWRNNLAWIREFFLSPHLPRTHFFGDQRDRPFSQRFFETILFPFAPLLEALFRRLQASRIKTSEYVLVSAYELAFHPDSKGQQILAKYLTICSQETA